jgi:hypothetical protein
MAKKNMRAAGSLSLVLLASLVVLAVLPAGAAGVTPTLLTGDPTCATISSEVPGAFMVPEPQATQGQTTQRTYTNPADGFKVTLGPISRTGFDLKSSNRLIRDVVIKGSGSNWYHYQAPGITADQGFVIPNGNKINRVWFCYDPNVITSGGTVDLGNFTITRGSDDKGPLAFTFDTGYDQATDRFFVDFQAFGGAQTEKARFLEIILWNLDTPPPNANPQERPLYYDDHVGKGERLMPWCKEDLWNETTRSAFFPAKSVNPLPYGHTSCRIYTETEVTATGLVSRDYVFTEIDGARWK